MINHKINAVITCALILSFSSCKHTDENKSANTVILKNNSTTNSTIIQVKDSLKDSLKVETNNKMDSLLITSVVKKEPTSIKTMKPTLITIKKIEYDKKTMVFTSYKIEDFSKWEKLYLQKSDTSSKLAYLLNVDNTLNIGVYQFTYGHQDFRKISSSKQCKDFILKTGIKSTPDYSYLNVMWLNPIQPKNEYYIIISHKVEDFVKWKVDFDANRQNRGFIGITDVFVATLENDINSVTMALATDNFETCKSLFTDEEVIAVLKKAGVVGELDISYWKVKSN